MGGFGIARNSFPMAVHTALLGGNIRVGFEDNYYLDAVKPAKDNAMLVEKAVSILELCYRIWKIGSAAAALNDITTPSCYLYT